MPSLKVIRIGRAFAFVLCISVTDARAQLVEEIGAVVDKILQHEEIHETGPVIVGGFLSNPQQDLHAAPAIKQHIVECLQQRGVRIEKRGPFPAISGTYKYVLTNAALIDIELDLTSHDGQRLQTYPAEVTFAEDNSQVLNIAAPSSVVLAPEARGFAHGQAVVTALKKPQVAISGGWISAPSGAYQASVLCESNGAYTRAIVDNQGGFAYVPMEMGQTYQIVCKNNSPYEAVATITVDGLDVFCFANAKSPGYLIPPNGGEQIIKGWYINESRADSFVLGRFADTPAAKLLGEAADAGVICVQFAAAWTPGNKPPDEGGTLGRGGVGTKRGNPVEQNVQRVPREVGKIREVVSVRYGT